MSECSIQSGTSIGASFWEIIANHVKKCHCHVYLIVISPNIFVHVSYALSTPTAVECRYHGVKHEAKGTVWRLVI